MGSATPFTSATNMPNGAAGAVDTAQVAIDKARETAGAAADAMGAEASHLADQAREYAERGRDALIETVNEHKGVGADYVSGVAETLRRVAGEFEQQAPFAAPYIRAAATHIDNVADGVRSGDPSQLVRQAQDFVRQQPTLVAGLAMLAGFGIMRLVKNAGASAPADNAGFNQRS